ncbi:hypothetical protein [Haladaptatus halobius]|uniref:hypothetical protein n=1 Tax=Haladaptatus halobius TaxID=2884875 RepID=UPI0034A1ED26
MVSAAGDFELLPIEAIVSAGIHLVPFFDSRLVLRHRLVQGRTGVDIQRFSKRQERKERIFQLVRVDRNRVAFCTVGGRFVRIFRQFADLRREVEQSVCGWRV